MDARVKMRYSAMLVAGLAGLAMPLVGCGGSDSPTPAGGTSTSSTSTPAASTLPETVDVNSATELASLLGKVGIETPASAPIESTRAAGASGVAFPMWPAGEVRKEALTTYRIDTTGEYDNDGTLKFVKGSTVLFEAPFTPEYEKTQKALPQSVVGALKAGDTVTWGVWFASKGKKAKPSTVSFTLVEKAQVDRATAKLAADRALDGVVLDMARAQVAKNYGLHSEALAIYTGIVEQDGRVTSVYTPMIDCLRALKLKDTPMFDLAKSRMLTGSSLRLRVTPGLAGAGPTPPGGPTLGTKPPFVPPAAPPSAPPSLPPVVSGGPVTPPAVGPTPPTLQQPIPSMPPPVALPKVGPLVPPKVVPAQPPALPPTPGVITDGPTPAVVPEGFVPEGPTGPVVPSDAPPPAGPTPPVVPEGFVPEGPTGPVVPSDAPPPEGPTPAVVPGMETPPPAPPPAGKGLPPPKPKLPTTQPVPPPSGGVPPTPPTPPMPPPLPEKPVPPADPVPAPKAP